MKRSHAMPFGAQPDGSGGVRFRLWAPAASRVELLLDRGGIAVPMVETGDGFFEITTSRADNGSLYSFRIDGSHTVPDPASRYQPDDVHGWSQVVFGGGFRWEDMDWSGRVWEETVIYELHVGTFTAEGTFSAAAGKLPHLADLGVTAVQLMPIADFPGRWGWGYDGVYPFAPESRYGTVDDLKSLIQSAHMKGLMLFLDVVYNHLGPEGNYLHLYTGDGFFSMADPTPWGPAVRFSGSGSGPVRDFFIHNALFWLNEYNVDGLRFDAVHAVRDQSEPHILEELARTVRAGPGRERRIHLVLENNLNDAGLLVRDPCKTPLLHTAQWNEDLHHALHVQLTGENAGCYLDFEKAPMTHLGRCLGQGFSFQGEPSLHHGGAPRGTPSAHLPPTAFVSYLQNHDEVGNRALSERLASLVSPEALRAATALLLLSPQIPLLFMGQEWSTRRPFPFFCDLEPDLGPRVFEGRKQELARFPGFGDPEKRARIPHPQDPATFASASIDWSEIDGNEHREWLCFFKKLLSIRRRRLVPRLGSIVQESLATSLLDDRGLALSFAFEDGATCTLLCNLSPTPILELPDPYRERLQGGELVFGLDNGAPGLLGTGALPPWSFFLFLDPWNRFWPVAQRKKRGEAVDSSPHRMDTVLACSGVRFSGAFLTRPIDRHNKRSASFPSLQDYLVLARKLCEAADLDTALAACIEAADRLPSIEASGIYLFEPDASGLTLAAQSSSSSGLLFNERFPFDSMEARLAGAGLRYFGRGSLFLSDEKKEIQRMAGVLPARRGNEVVGCLVVALGPDEEASTATELMLEPVAAGIGSTVGRLDVRKRSGRKKRALTELSDAIFLLDPRLDCLFASRSVEPLLGYTRDELSGRSMSRVLEDQGIEVREVMEKEWTELRTADLPGLPGSERKLLRRNGTSYWGEIRLLPLMSGEKRPEGVMGFIRNVSIQDVLAAGRRDLSGSAMLLIENLPDGVLITDVAGEVTQINQTAADHLGYSKQEIIGRKIFDFVVLEEGSRWLLDSRKDESQKDAVASIECLCHRKDGTVFPGSMNLSLLRDSAGKARAVIVVTRDVTQQKRKQHEQGWLFSVVERAAAEWRRTFDAVDSLVLLLGTTGEIIRMNRLAKDLSERSYQENIGKSIASIGDTEPWQTMTRLVEKVVANQKSYSEEARDEISGRTWDTTATFSAGGEDDDRIIIVARDITRVVELQQSLQRSETMSVLGSLLGGVAHEIRNPIFGISATLDAFEARFGEKPEFSRYVEVLRKELGRMTTLLQELLDFGKPACIETRLSTLEEIVSRAVEQCRPMSARSQVEITSRIPSKMPACRVDEAGMIRAFRNLIENAIQHSPLGGTVLIDAEKTTRRGQDWVVCRVADSGPGFPTDLLTRVFDPFFSRRSGGTGLGLSIVQRVAVGHGGKVVAANRTEGGAVVTMTIPCVTR